MLSGAILRRPQRTGELQSMVMFEIEHWQPGLRCARTGKVTRLITQPVYGDLQKFSAATD
jgi:hypothetical protein